MFYYVLVLSERKRTDSTMTDNSETADDTSGARERLGERGAAGVGAGPAMMRDIGGSSVDAFNMLIARQTTAALSVGLENDEERRAKAAAAFAALTGIAPRSEVEGMLAAQLIACHDAAMVCFRRAAHPAQLAEVRAENLALGGRLSRATAALVEALDRRRGEGGPKTVIVEHRVSHVEPGFMPSPAPRIPAPHKGNGNGHALNGHKAANGAALP
ncbi:MAG: hypothetical protein ACKV2U_04620 [Bryobacteraceae bacterium]